MPANMNSAAAKLKGQLGLPHGDVNQPAAASSTAPSAITTPRQPTQAEQIAEAQSQVAQVQAAQPAQTPDQSALEAKDQAISTLTERTQQLEAAMNSQTQKVSELLEKLSAGQQQANDNSQQQLQLPSLPDNINDLSVEEQMHALQNTLKETQDALTSTISERDNQLRQLLGPMGHELGKVVASNDKASVLDKYPNFRYEEYKEDVQRLRAQMPGMTAIEAAELVAVRKDRDMLNVNDDVPHTEAVIPSAQAASGRPGVSSQPTDDARESQEKQLKGLIIDAQFQGQTTQANNLIDHLLRSKLGNRLQRT